METHIIAHKKKETEWKTLGQSHMSSIPPALVPINILQSMTQCKDKKTLSVDHAQVAVLYLHSVCIMLRTADWKKIRR
jgi:hypothetical protein